MVEVSDVPKYPFNNAGGQITVVIDGDKGDISAGGNGQKGGVELRGEDGTLVGYLSAGAGGASLAILAQDGKQRAYLSNSGDFNLGGNGTPGQMRLLPATAMPGIVGQTPQPTIYVDGENGSILLKKNNQDSIVLNAQLGNIAVGGPAGAAGNIFIFPENSSAASIQLDGQSGDIVLSNADCAEDFDIYNSEAVCPGMVMVIDQEDLLRPSTEPYDTKVAGVVSGAGGFRPGLVLDRKHPKNNRLPVALMGKVYCLADAGYSSIEVGNLLTTSSTPGHAMKAIDPQRSFGAVIGKALRPLKSGRGLIPLLIALQ